MVQLYGIIHSGHIDSLHSSRSVPIHPTRELLLHLARLPKATKVGMEWFREDDWKEVRQDLATRSIAADVDNFPYFDSSTSHYWESLLPHLHQFGLVPVFLENKEIWFRLQQRREIACQEELPF